MLTLARRRAVRRVFKHMTSHRVDRLARRARLAAIIAEHSVAGRMLVSVRGTDCDGYNYGPSRSIHTASVMVYELEVERRQEFADGPVYVSVVRGADREHWEDAHDGSRCALASDDYRSFKGLPWNWRPAFD